MEIYSHLQADEICGTENLHLTEIYLLFLYLFSYSRITNTLFQTVNSKSCFTLYSKSFVSSVDLRRWLCERQFPSFLTGNRQASLAFVKSQLFDEVYHQISP